VNLQRHVRADAIRRSATIVLTPDWVHGPGDCWTQSGITRRIQCVRRDPMVHEPSRCRQCLGLAGQRAEETNNDDLACPCRAQTRASEQIVAALAGAQVTLVFIDLGDARPPGVKTALDDIAACEAHAKRDHGGRILFAVTAAKAYRGCSSSIKYSAVRSMSAGAGPVASRRRFRTLVSSIRMTRVLLVEQC
jgi:hypothetical protein